MSILKALKRAFTTHEFYSHDAYVQNQRDLKQLEYRMMMAWAQTPR